MITTKYSSLGGLRLHLRPGYGNPLDLLNREAMSVRILSRRMASLAIRKPIYIPSTTRSVKPVPHLSRFQWTARLQNASLHTTSVRQEQQPADLSIDEFHDISEEYLNTLCEKLEDMQESRTDLDVEYSVSSRL